jgi:hypothetical protein
MNVLSTRALALRGRAALGSLLLMSAVPAGAVAQTISAISRPVAATAGAPRLSHADAPRDSSHAAKTFFNRGDLELLGVGLAVSAGVSLFDQRIRNWAQSPGVQGSAGRHDLVEHLTVINEQPLTLGALATYGIGRLLKSETIADVGLHTTEALVLTVAMSEAIRGPLGRARPRTSPQDPYDFSFWSGFTDFGKRSYPSLHAAVGFATATALTREIHARNPGASHWAAPILYAAAMVPGLTRMYLDQHWTSDVVAGSILGAAIGSKVVGYAHSHDRNRLDRWLLGASITPAPSGGLMVGYTRNLGSAPE